VTPVAAVGTGLRRALRAAAAVSRRGYEQIEPNIAAIGVVGVIGFPLYYVIWRHLFPQEYENLPLRLGGVLVCVAGALKDHWPRPLRRLLRPAWYAGVTYVLPFFFTYMAIANHLSPVWMMSALVAFFLLVLLLDWLALLAIAPLGAGLAWLAAGATIEAPPPWWRVAEYLPVFAFVVVAGTIFNYKAELLRRERRRAVQAFARAIADELREPLAAMRVALTGVARQLPGLAAPGGGGRLAEIAAALDRLDAESRRVAAIADLLGPGAPDQAPRRLVAMSSCIARALAAYPFHSEQERARLVVQRDGDFLFRGDPEAMTQVLVRLIRNGLHGVAAAGKGEVTVRVGATERGGELSVRDNGAGIPANQLAGIFDGDSPYLDPAIAGSGGLGYCRSVVEALGGTIVCRAELDGFSEFVVRLPRADGVEAGTRSPAAGAVPERA
jgi:two-component system CAI-1 autoinducer sensor kinase/phosphatase CqsS